MTAGEGAWEGFLSSVNPDVVCEEPGPGEGLVAVVALEVPVVSLHVHGQGGHARVELAALLAALPSVGVDLAVARQVAARGEHLAAVRTTFALLPGSRK